METRLPEFPRDKLGLIVFRFSGPSLSEFFGEDGIESHIRSRISSQLNALGIDTLLRVEVADITPSTIEQAEQLSAQCGATSFLWITGVRVGSRVDMNIVLDAGTVVWELKKTGGSIAEPLGIHLQTGPKFSLYLDSARYNFDELIRGVTTDLIPPLVTKVIYSNPSLAAQLLDSLPVRDRYYRDSDYNGFLVLTMAGAYERAGESTKAIQYLNLSFEMFENLYVRAKNRVSELQVPDSTVRRFAAFTKWRSGDISVRRGDTVAAAMYYRFAMCIDTALAVTMRMNLRALGRFPDTDIECKKEDSKLIDWF